MKLQRQVEKLRAEQESLLKPAASPSSIAVDPTEDVPLLIDLESPSDDQSRLPPSTDSPLPHDLLGAAMETSDHSHPLQPEVLTNTQSQELF